MTTPFLETPRFPDAVAFWAQGGPGYNTTVVVLNSGWEKRNANWEYARCRFDISPGMRTPAGASAAIAMFRTAKARAYGFRFKDFRDYDANVGGAGILSARETATSNIGNGTGEPTLQLYKSYATGAMSENRIIQKPVSGTVGVLKNSVAQTAGNGAGQYALDTATGLVTFVANETSNVTAVTVGANTQVTITGNLTLTAGGQLYLTGLGGADAALLNGMAHEILSRTGSGPYVFTIDTDTTGATITASGTGARYPQESDVMTWTGEFDVPVRFDSDNMTGGPDGSQEGGGAALFQWQAISLVELRIRDES